MAFDSLSYGLFLALAVLIFRLPFKRPGEILPGLFLFFSVVFYAFAGFLALGVFVLSILVNHSLARAIHPAQGPSRRNWMLLGLAFNLAYLYAFKYAAFFQQSWGSLGAWLGWWTPPAELVEVLLPVGISFYTFESLSLLVDVHQGRYQPPRLMEYALFVGFFPHLIAGPILRGKDLLPQFAALRQGRPTVDWRRGVAFLSLGLFKKAVLADSLALFVDPVFADPAGFGAEKAWLAAYGFAFRIFFDFSGYSDMAEGSAALFGIRLTPNFRAPYSAATLADFWRRWHITLSSWLRDYLYIPLGGSRSGLPRTAFALVVTFLLGGLWHGASLTFLVWGLFHGGLLALERVLGASEPPAGAAGKAARAFLTFHLVVLGWVFFRAASLASALTFLGQAFGGPWTASSNDLGMLALLALAALFSVWEARWEEGAWSGGSAGFAPLALAGLQAAAFVFKVALSDLGQTFIYFRF